MNRSLILCLMLAALSSCGGASQGGDACARDTDCKGDRVCNAGVCMAPIESMGGADAGLAPDGGVSSDGGVADAGHTADAGPFPVGVVRMSGTATLLGRSDWSGTNVSIGGTSVHTTTAADGTWTLNDLPEGYVDVHFSNGPFDWTMRSVIALSNIPTFPPMDVPRARFLTPTIATVPSTSQPSPFYKQNEKLIVGERGALSVVSTTTGETISLEATANSPALTPDGASVVYVTPSETNGTLVLKVLSLADRAVTTVATDVLPTEGDFGGLYTVFPFAVTPDSGHVLFAAAQGSSFVLNGVSIHGGAVTPLMTFASADWAGIMKGQYGMRAWFTPDSTRVIVCGASQVSLVRVDGSQAASMVGSTTGGCSDYHTWITGDGKRFITSSNSSQMMNVLPLVSGFSAMTVTGNNVYAVAPDGNSMAVATASGLVWVSLVNGMTQTISTTPVNGTRVAFTPDGQYVLWSNGTAIDRFSVSTGQNAQVVTWPGDGASVSSRPLLPSPDGTTVYSVHGSGENLLAAVNLTSHAVSELGTINAQVRNGRAYPPSMILSPNGAQLAVNAWSTAGYVLYSVPTSGLGSPTKLLATDSFAPRWIDNGRILALKAMTPSPYESQDGFYAVPVP